MKSIIVFSLLVLSLPGFTLDYTDFVKKIEALPESEIQSIGTVIAQNSIMENNAVNDIHVNAQTFYKSSWEGSSLFNQQNFKGINTSITADKLFSSTGSFIQAGISYQTLNPSNTVYHKPEIILTFKQPLWDNWMGKLTHFPIANAEVNHEVEELKARQEIQSLVYNYSLMYFNYIYLNRMISLQEKELKNFIRLQNLTRQKLRDGLVDNDHYQSARYQVLSYQENIFQMKQSRAILSNKLYSLVQALPDPDQWNLFRTKITESGLKNVKYDNTLGARVLKLTRSQMDLNLDFQNNQSKPALNFLAQLGLFNIDADFSTAFQLSQHPEYFLGLEFSWLPIDNKSKANIDTARLNLKKLDQETIIIKRNYQNNSFELKKIFSQIDRELSFNKEQIESILKRRISEKKKYNQGRFSLNDLILTENLLLKEKIDTIT